MKRSVGDARCLGYKSRILASLDDETSPFLAVKIPSTPSGLISADLSSTPQVLQLHAGSFFEQWLVIEPIPF